MTARKPNYQVKQITDPAQHQGAGIGEEFANASWFVIDRFSAEDDDFDIIVGPYGEKEDAEKELLKVQLDDFKPQGSGQ